MTEYVNADSLFEWLFEQGYCERFVWKNLNLQTSKYTASFFCKNCELTNLHIFEITVRNNVHYVSKLALKIFCMLHGLDYNNVIKKIEK